MSHNGSPATWLEHWNPDDPLFDPEDDRPSDQHADYLRLFDDPEREGVDSAV